MAISVFCIPYFRTKPKQGSLKKMEPRFEDPFLARLGMASELPMACLVPSVSPHCILVDEQPMVG